MKQVQFPNGKIQFIDKTKKPFFFSKEKIHLSHEIFFLGTFSSFEIEKHRKKKSRSSANIFFYDDTNTKLWCKFMINPSAKHPTLQVIPHMESWGPKMDQYSAPQT